jgi:hypothetical protein
MRYALGRSTIIMKSMPKMFIALLLRGYEADTRLRCLPFCAGWCRAAIVGSRYLYPANLFMAGRSSIVAVRFLRLNRLLSRSCRSTRLTWMALKPSASAMTY